MRNCFKPTYNKYHNTKTEVDGIVFDSKKEAKYYLYLKQLEKEGKITDLQRQVQYELVPAVWRDEIVHLKTKDKTVRRLVQRAINYVADFVYTDTATGATQVIDAKGFRLETYKLKKKMMRAFHGIDIKEV